VIVVGIFQNKYNQFLSNDKFVSDKKFNCSFVWWISDHLCHSKLSL